MMILEVLSNVSFLSSSACYNKQEWAVVPGFVGARSIYCLLPADYSYINFVPVSDCSVENVNNKGATNREIQLVEIRRK